ncbi:MAG: hypothetical protein SNJ84_04355 [Verrucomicrobiia bacterium]
MGWWLGLGLGLMVGWAGMGVAVGGPRLVERAVIDHPELTEISGMAASRLRADTVWVVNDSGHGPRVYAIDRQGRSLGSAEVGEASNRDWEDLASFVWRGRSYLAIADIGDNRGRRSRVSIYIVPEPRFKGGRVAEGRVVPVRTVVFTYPDGPRDAEGLGVDVQRERFVVLSKRERVPTFYEVPLGLGRERGPFVARPVGRWRSPSVVGRLFIRSPESAPLVAQMPTGLDLAPDGRSLVVLDYLRVWWFRGVGRELPGEQVEALPLHGLDQAEAVCFSADGREVWVTTEGHPAPLLIYRLPGE